MVVSPQAPLHNNLFSKTIDPIHSPGPETCLLAELAGIQWLAMLGRFLALAVSSSSTFPDTLNAETTSWSKGAVEFLASVVLAVLKRSAFDADMIAE